MTAKAIGEVLGYATPSESILKIFQRHEEQFKDYSCKVNLTLQGDQARETRIFNEEGIYLISIYANTPTARRFQIQVAKFLKAERQRRQEDALKIVQQETAKAVCELFNSLNKSTLKLLSRCQTAGLSEQAICTVTGLPIPTVHRFLQLTATTVTEPLPEQGFAARQNKSMEEFAKTITISGRGERIPASLLYKRYVDFCHSSGYSPAAKNLLGRFLTAKGLERMRGTHGENGYAGIKMEAEHE
jgi:prophage antirepressor-like protein